MKKIRDLVMIFFIYLIAYAVGFYTGHFFESMILRYFIFDTVATVVTFIFSVILVNSSVYDAYWSLTPMVMSIYLFIEKGAFSPWQIAFLLAFNVWSLRLTINWITVFTDFSYEDWRYKKFRDTTPKLFWPLVNFFGIHYMPTLMVFGGMLPMFKIADNKLGALSVPGILVILLGVVLEYFADRDMHDFLKNAKPGTVCDNGLWKYSRHPNYLGEITVWLGVFLTMLPYELESWYLGVGFVCIAIMFEVISIPLMEKRQKSRRPEYVDYCKKTSRLLLLPNRK